MDTSFYLFDELDSLGLGNYGNNVKISRNSRFYNPENIIIGDNVRIDDFCILSGNITIGNNVHIAAYSCLYAGDSQINIQDFANISGRVSVYAISDDYSGLTMSNPTIDEKFKNVLMAPVNIEKHVIVGSGSVVLPGVKLRVGSVFGAMSLVNHSSSEWSVNVGIPFREIKKRSKKLLNLEEIFKSHDK